MANLLGAADQKWIEDFRGVIAELEGLVSERGNIQDTQKQSGNTSYEIGRAMELGHRFDPLVAKIHLLISPADRELTLLIRRSFAASEAQSRVDLGYQMFGWARRIIEQKVGGHRSSVAAIDVHEDRSRHEKAAFTEPSPQQQENRLNDEPPAEGRRKRVLRALFGTANFEREWNWTDRL